MTRRLRHCQVNYGAMAFLVGAGLLASYPVETAKKFSEWSAPTNLGAVVNSVFNEILPHISKDELSLYFTSDRPGGFDGFDIWISQRATPDDPWGSPMNLGPTINTSDNDQAPALSRDGHFLFFSSNRPVGFGSLDIWVSWRTNTHDDFGWQPPVNLGSGVNGAAPDFGPSYLENEDIGVPSLFLASRRPGDSDFDSDIYVSNLLANGSFGPALLITELATPQDDFRPTVRPDGLELIFFSDRPSPPGMVGVGNIDLWTSVRESVSAPWSTPTHLGSIVNSESVDGGPALSSDGTTLIFYSFRPLGFGGADLYMSSRAKPD
jgi:WD40-like Beta Propeller Repeat